MEDRSWSEIGPGESNDNEEEEEWWTKGDIHDDVGY